MKAWPLVLSLGAFVAGFPSVDNLHHAGLHSHKKAAKRCPLQDMQDELINALKDQHDKRFLFSSMDIPIDITGEHEFQPPDFANGDQRGPCPGLNALANHGYIPRSGIAPFGKVIHAINEVYGMGLDLALILAIMGTVWTGNPLSVDPGFSIGGRDTGVNNILGNGLNLLGEPRGLQGSHNFIEADSSNTRDDLYVTGNAWTMNMTLFKEWYDMSEDGTFSMDLMAERAAIRFEQTKASNPDFYYGPVTGLIARNAGYIFPARLFRNHSQELPEGVLTKEIVRNFFAVYGDEDSLEYREGWERIPENWYRTPVDWGLLNLNVDVMDWVAKHPELGSIGGNTGTVNSFVGLDLSDMTGGVFNLATLLKDNNLLCFVFEILKFLSPNALGGLYETLTTPLELLTDALKIPLLDLACPALEDLTMDGKPLWEALEQLFPGALKSSSAL
ncbi:peroxidase family protein [Aspergillus lucknowensis]|uniref:Chloroperoxidase n=1 Tax=Aspergillus lucknowensis TaxID=176173 RepID=A0ABR4M2A5_9EURO